MEFLIELLLEETITISTSKKIPFIIRYPLIILIVGFYILLIGIILLVSISLLKEKNYIGSIVILLIDIVILVGLIKLFKDSYIKKKGELND